MPTPCTIRPWRSLCPFVTSVTCCHFCDMSPSSRGREGTSFRATRTTRARSLRGKEEANTIKASLGISLPYNACSQSNISTAVIGRSNDQGGLQPPSPAGCPHFITRVPRARGHILSSRDQPSTATKGNATSFRRCVSTFTPGTTFFHRSDVSRYRRVQALKHNSFRCLIPQQQAPSPAFSRSLFWPAGRLRSTRRLSSTTRCTRTPCVISAARFRTSGTTPSRGKRACTTVCSAALSRVAVSQAAQA